MTDTVHAAAPATSRVSDAYRWAQLAIGVGAMVMSVEHEADRSVVGADAGGAMDGALPRYSTNTRHPLRHFTAAPLVLIHPHSHPYPRAEVYPAPGPP